MTDITPEHERLATVARGYFAALGAHAELRVIPLAGGGVCVVDAVRGGGKIYVARDGSALFVSSALDFEAGLIAFRDGRRSLTATLARPPVRDG
ncbi:hypothetical protein [Marisediminicola sp. LYQ134]|uniref:hypothetical protein n=1 Tax=Marisediminicola sp. LYQ134 TaxID=3391061 RepID=UPI0039838423